MNDLHNEIGTPQEIRDHYIFKNSTLEYVLSSCRTTDEVKKYLTKRINVYDLLPDKTNEEKGLLDLLKKWRDTL